GVSRHGLARNPGFGGERRQRRLGLPGPQRPPGLAEDGATLYLDRFAGLDDLAHAWQSGWEWRERRHDQRIPGCGHQPDRDQFDHGHGDDSYEPDFLRQLE